MFCRCTLLIKHYNIIIIACIPTGSYKSVKGVGCDDVIAKKKVSGFNSAVPLPVAKCTTSPSDFFPRCMVAISFMTFYHRHDSSGNPQWDTMTNCQVMKVEFALNVRMAANHGWNITTSKWLRR